MRSRSTRTSNLKRGFLRSKVTVSKLHKVLQTLQTQSVTFDAESAALLLLLLLLVSGHSTATSATQTRVISCQTLQI